MKMLTQLLPYASVLIALLAAWWAYQNGKSETKIKGIEVLDARQEQIAEWGFQAADEANKRAERIAAEANSKVQDLQTQLNELRDILERQSAAHREAIKKYEDEIAALKAQHEAELSERNNQVAVLHAELTKLRARVQQLEGTNA